LSELICGSMAYDNIMVFPGRFKEHILADQLHILNVAFLVPEMRREFGGCAGNIAYNLQMLGGDPLIMATVGTDFGAYRDLLARYSLDERYIVEIADTLTAQAYITTDLDDNQITAFHPGAMNFSHENKITDALKARLAIVSPDGRDGMLQHASECAECGIPFMFDPGQGLPMFSSDELRAFVGRADFVAVNDYEGKMLEEKTGETLESLARQVKALVVTRGARGSLVMTDGQRHEIPCVEADQVVDPTGCGDAYRAALLHGIAAGWDWPTAARLGAVMGAIKIAQRGGQNHKPSRAEISDRFRDAFGYSPWDA
jgi:adenosine kinase